MDLSVLIVTYNCADLVRQCIQSVLEKTIGIRMEILIYDNASGDRESLRALEPMVARIVYGERNLGFGQANNALAREARGEFIVCLNPDTILLDDALTWIVRHLQCCPAAGIAAPLLINGDGSRQFSWNLPMGLAWELCEAHYLQNIYRDRAESAMRRANPHGPWRVGFSSGACLGMRREEFLACGGFDPDFFLNHEDIELCDRIRASGKEIHVLPGLRVVHLDGGTQKANWRRFTKDRMTGKWVYLGKRFSGWRLWVVRALWFEEIAWKTAIGAIVLRGSGRTRIPGFLDAVRWVLQP